VSARRCDELGGSVQCDECYDVATAVREYETGSREAAGSLLVLPVAWIRRKIWGSGQGQSGQAIKLFLEPRKISFTFRF